jgi:septum formation protein
VDKEKVISQAPAEDTLLENAQTKAVSLLPMVKDRQTILIGSDTLVIHQGRVLAKPESKTQVKEWMGSFSASDHIVQTALFLIQPETGRRLD